MLKILPLKYLNNLLYKDEPLKNQQTTPLQTTAKQTKTQKTLVALLFMWDLIVFLSILTVISEV